MNRAAVPVAERESCRTEELPETEALPEVPVPSDTVPNVLQQVADEAAVASAAAAVSVHRLEGVFLRVVREHRDAAALFRRIKSGADLAAREDLWFELSAALLAHERAELQEVYAAFQTHPSLAAITNEHATRAGHLEELIAELDALPFNSSDWPTALDLLEAAHQRHVQQEETQFFPTAQAVIGKQQAEKLESAYGSAIDVLITSIRAVQRATP